MDHGNPLTQPLLRWPQLPKRNVTVAHATIDGYKKL